MKKLSLILGITIALITITGAIYRFDYCKASRESVQQLAGNFEIYKLEQYRNALQIRIWDLQRAFPQTYQSHPEYIKLVIEIQQADKKLEGYYKTGGK